MASVKMSQRLQFVPMNSAKNIGGIVVRGVGYLSGEFTVQKCLACSRV